MAEIKRILVANRGEIALRAIRTIKEMGKEAVAVYSTADKGSEYLKLADAAICIGDGPSSKSYLNIPAIIAAAEISDCDAIFPGYGFLSENQHFVEICSHHNIKFIGPTPEVMVLMSDKSKAKDVMIAAGVPVVPGSDGAIDDIADAKERAKEVGYPVILKAAQGGGGRGMRVVEEESYLENAFLAAESEAVTAFGDGTIYMEKFIKDPRHIEVQIMADAHGNVLHIGERDCSMQRRHQKLIEESPAVVLTQEVRERLWDAAVRATKFIKYEGAGTFEFLLDANLDFYFMEMNTRLQVEHTVSEMVSDLDLVKMMIEIAEGKELPAQETIILKGHSIECRITAEDPIKFLPCPGKIISWIAPGGKDVRIDTHAHAGYIVPMIYDSMIGKLIVYGKTREEAIARMHRALSEFSVTGIKTTIAFHKKMMENPDFINNNFNTKYLEKYNG
ncbi:MAG: acetyl-CoA carboxylase biotin carboxylase subunit [Epsilonproteobacteria bacterium]|nr:acetyl-CoA carboxylase biotin carboxylase subunit [Campylobacterota bacterium]OIO13829.1 MAG: acetyl-CoA carboxylase biotin carboxylase subunit [Helicobacteraceae bacterium CG1_02_36_14]PIP11478.1 MAG: acetyl-CoA carboxylase biotin carboxylase subunit [Sulfurimonas sp. CG23_combo_of_CG06-09_8_20_14_all_36_33]PIS25097.1 MAG: acetyl-CoA carboxylase biotin carboxylase subunit [Sulfurimonas sp. CG08_land_8_20_14_0_20_36_33]PIU34638.1 MAG: acetyl-CoA carboxylase biotin carboxylase subunit [Sulfur